MLPVALLRYFVCVRLCSKRFPRGIVISTGNLVACNHQFTFFSLCSCLWEISWMGKRTVADSTLYKQAESMTEISVPPKNSDFLSANKRERNQFPNWCLVVFTSATRTLCMSDKSWSRREEKRWAERPLDMTRSPLSRISDFTIHQISWIAMDTFSPSNIVVVFAVVVLSPLLLLQLMLFLLTWQTLPSRWRQVQRWD